MQVIIFQRNLAGHGHGRKQSYDPEITRRKSVNTCDKCKYLYKETWEEKCWDTPAWCRHAKLPLREFNQKLNNKRLGDWGCTLWEYKNK